MNGFRELFLRQWRNIKIFVLEDCDIFVFEIFSFDLFL